MASHLQMEYDVFQANNPPTTSVSTSCRNIPSHPSSRHNHLSLHSSSINKLSHLRHFSNAQLSPPSGLTSTAPGRAVPPGLLNVGHYNTSVNLTSLPFKHKIPSVVLPTPTLQQKREIQLAGREPFDLTFSLQNPELYIHVDDPPLVQVLGASVAVDNNLRGVTGPPSLLGLSIDYTPVEMSSPGLHTLLHAIPLVGDSPQAPHTQSPVPNKFIEFPQPPSSGGHNPQHVPPVLRGRCYDRPGKKPAAVLELHPIKLHDKICKERGSSNFATDWILTVFKHRVNKSALHRALKSQEITAMNFTGGFEPRQVYDGFITKVGDWYECGLCREDKRVYWKAKKNAPRHLCKFHFGLADVCNICGKNLYSKGDGKSHGCKPLLLPPVQ